MPKTSAKTLVLYDGVCGLCNRLNQFLLTRDPDDHFRFASLQSKFAESLLQRYDIKVDFDTFYALVDFGQPSEHLLMRSDAALHVLGRLGRVWRLLRIGKALPKSLRDALYNLIARNRYSIFGKYDVCLMPEEKYRKKFLDLVNTKPS